METQIQNTTETVETKKLGRPVNPESKRQQVLQARTQRGELKRGRPVVEGSKRQQVLAARAAKIENGGELKRGRPVNPNSARQQKLNK